MYSHAVTMLVTAIMLPIRHNQCRLCPSSSDFTSYIKAVQRRNGNTLSGLSFDEILSRVTDPILEQQSKVLCVVYIAASLTEELVQHSPENRATLPLLPGSKMQTCSKFFSNTCLGTNFNRETCEVTILCVSSTGWNSGSGSPCRRICPQPTQGKTCT